MKDLNELLSKLFPGQPREAIESMRQAAQTYGDRDIHYLGRLGDLLMACQADLSMSNGELVNLLWVGPEDQLRMILGNRIDLGDQQNIPLLAKIGVLLDLPRERLEKEINHRPLPENEPEQTNEVERRVAAMDNLWQILDG